MKQLQLLLHDRRRRQRGSVLSALLIIVAFLSILIGALLTELTDSFVVSRELVARAGVEATATSAVELAINQLQAGPVPPVCAKDTSANPSPPRPETWTLTSLNGHPATVSQTCKGILPEVVKIVAPGSFTVDGVRDTRAGRNRYLVSDSAGQLYSYKFGQTTATPGWPIWLGGGPSGPPFTAADPNGSVNIFVPVAKPGGTCAGHCVVVFNDTGGQPSFHCDLPANSLADGVAGGSGNFPGYAFFGDSGHLYAFDARSNHTCTSLAQSPTVGGKVAGAPLVFPGRVTNGGDTKSDEVFILVTSSSGTNLQHWRFTETIDEGGGEGGSNQTLRSWTPVGNLSLNGSNAVGYGISLAAPPWNLVVATASGRLDLVRISGSSGSSYTMSAGASIVLPNGATTAHAPYWCNCPGNVDLIGVGGTNGLLYLFDGGLNVAYSYDGQPDGRPAINTTPMADPNGEWYFGANDGSIYNVEIPVSGPQMFKAARFGRGGAIASSPIVGACPNGPCLYFGSSSAGSYFARIGSTRVSDLRACVSSAAGSTTCAANPRLWARVQIGPGGIWGGSGVFVQGWSFYSP